MLLAMKYIQYIPLIIALVKAVETAGSGQAKLQAVLALVQSFTGLNVGNAKVQAEITGIVNAIVSVYNAVGLFGHTGPTPVPAPPPAADPTSIEYDTEDEAKAAATATDPNVILKGDGKFGVWPQLTPPNGATIVWTLPA